MVTADASDCSAASVSELVEQTGIRRWHMQVLVLAPLMCYFIDGADLTSVNVVTESTAAEFHYGAHLKSTLVVVTFLGVSCGSLMAALLGDSVGRRPVILASYSIMAVGGVVGSFAVNLTMLMVCRIILGVGMGLSFAVSILLVSENAPEHARVYLRGASKIALECGVLAVALFTAADDAEFHSLRWRRLMMLCAVVPFLFLLLGLVYLPESPVFLACSGRREEAEQGFAQMQGLHDHRLDGVRYAEPHLPTGTHALSVGDKFRVVFSPEYRLASVAAMAACVQLHLAHYGDIYAVAQVFPSESKLPAAWQLVLRQVVALMMAIPCISFCQATSRKTSMLTQTLLMAASMSCFAYGGSYPMPRAWNHEVLFQSGTCCIGVAQVIGYISIYQYVVEIYPPTVASFGSALTIGLSRLGAVIASPMFEYLKNRSGRWTTFYYTTAALGLLVAILLSLAPNLGPYRVKALDEKALGEAYGSCK